MLRVTLEKWSRLFGASCVICDRTAPGWLCEACRARGPVTTITPAGLHVSALHLHEGALRQHIHALKYEEQTRWAARLGGALARQLQAELSAGVLVPIPLHPARLAERGYNQAALLARAVARRAPTRVAFELLARSKETEKQAALGRSDRARNAADAFEVRSTRISKFRGLPLWLVDDVATTGVTLDAAAHALTAAGLSVAGALTIALADRQLDATSNRSSEPTLVG